MNESSLSAVSLDFTGSKSIISSSSFQSSTGSLSAVHCLFVLQSEFSMGFGLKFKVANNYRYYICIKKESNNQFACYGGVGSPIIVASSLPFSLPLQLMICMGYSITFLIT